jgi:hypothetical protein
MTAERDKDGGKHGRAVKIGGVVIATAVAVGCPQFTQRWVGFALDEIA